jgi:hypothetical protein
MKQILIGLLFLLTISVVYAQRKDVQKIFVATTEQEVFLLYNQMLDSARVSNRFLSPSRGTKNDYFAFGFFKEIASKDTLIKIVQSCRQTKNNYTCKRFYQPYITSTMSIDFYERFLDYLEKINITENFFIKDEINRVLIPIRRIIIKQYESGKLTARDSNTAKRLIESTILKLIKNNHNYRGLFNYETYITDTIRQALVDVIKNPFYPTEYVDFYMSKQDTLSIDTVGISNYAKIRNWMTLSGDSLANYQRMLHFQTYEKIGREKYNELSAGQAYLQSLKDDFYEKGYLPIKDIEEYAYQRKDEILIQHLKEFKKKHPDYPLKYF